MTEPCSPPPFSLSAWPGGFGEVLGRQGPRAEPGIVIIWNPLMESWGRIREGEEEGWSPPSNEAMGRHNCMHMWLLEMSDWEVTG